MTEPAKEYYTAFAQLQMALKPIKKSKIGHNWTYASIDDILQVILPLLDVYGFTIESSRKLIGSQMFLRTCLVHTPSLQGVEDLSPLLAYNSQTYDDQEVGENVTYQRRYALMVLLNLQTEEDNIEKRPRLDHKRHEKSNTAHTTASSKTIDPQKVDMLRTLIAGFGHGATLEKNILAFNKISSFEQLTEDQYIRVLSYIKDNSPK
jgi:hypothetical protein